MKSWYIAALGTTFLSLTGFGGWAHAEDLGDFDAIVERYGVSITEPAGESLAIKSEGPKEFCKCTEQAGEGQISIDACPDCLKEEDCKGGCAILVIDNPSPVKVGVCNWKKRKKCGCSIKLSEVTNPPPGETIGCDLSESDDECTDSLCLLGGQGLGNNLCPDPNHSGKYIKCNGAMAGDAAKKCGPQ